MCNELILKRVLENCIISHIYFNASLQTGYQFFDTSEETLIVGMILIVFLTITSFNTSDKECSIKGIPKMLVDPNKSLLYLLHALFLILNIHSVI